jgi:hypothetical protein
VAGFTRKALFPPHALIWIAMDENTAGAVDRGDGSHGFYRVDLRSLAAPCRGAKRIISRRCLRFMSCHLPWVAARACFLGFLGSFSSLGFHATFPALNSTWLGPLGETLSVSPAGSGLSFFKEWPPPSIQSPTPEPCLTSGRNAPKKMRL